MSINGRQKIYVWAAFLALLILTSSIPSLSLLTDKGALATDIRPPNVLGQISFALIPFYLIIILFFLLPLLRSRKGVIGIALFGGILLFFAWAIAMLGNIPPPAYPTAVPPEAVEEEVPVNDPTPAPTPSIIQEAPQETPSWFATIFNIAITLILVTAVAFAIRQVWPRQIDYSFMELSRDAEQALADITSGGDFNNAILRCYHDMSHTINEFRGVNRSHATTPREFEETLIRLGLPEEPVITLTRLFETVRYSANEMPPEAEEEAINSLTAVIAACKEAE